MLAYRDNAIWTRWTNQPRPLNGEGSYQLPRTAEQAYTDDELAAYGLFRVAPVEVPAGKRIVSSSVTDQDGVPVEVLELEEIVPTVADVEAERARRLAAGFDYDFGDDRGVHRIGTAAEDMIGWQEVTTLANALLATGIAAPIAIETDTGPATITAAEWQQILIAAAQFRQPIWLASFALAAMDPIPADFRDDSYWSAA